MGQGKIVDFSKGNQSTEVKRLSHTNVDAQRAVVVDKSQGGEPLPVEVRQHEEVIVEDQDKVRHTKKDGSPDLRFRQARSSKEWEKIRRGDWEES